VYIVVNPEVMEYKNELAVGRIHGIISRELSRITACDLM